MMELSYIDGYGQMMPFWLKLLFSFCLVISQLCFIISWLTIEADTDDKEI